MTLGSNDLFVPVQGHGHTNNFIEANRCLCSFATPGDHTRGHNEDLSDHAGFRLRNHYGSSLRGEKGGVGRGKGREIQPRPQTETSGR